jgi:hypothetical protein
VQEPEDLDGVAHSGVEAQEEKKKTDAAVVGQDEAQGTVTSTIKYYLPNKLQSSRHAPSEAENGSADDEPGVDA